MSFTYEDYLNSAAFIRERLPFFPERALVIGSGLGEVIREMEEAVSIPYEDIPGMKPTGVASHAGKLIAGRLAGEPLLVLSGRLHFYEGYTMEQAAFPVRVLKLLGVKTLILTNAAGGVSEDLTVGGLMLITDHIKLTSDSPVRGPNLDAFGKRFFDMGHAYSERLLSLARAAAREVGITIYEGTYFYMPGPQFETPAEIRAIRILGGDAVGMSTVGETISAAQCGLEVLGISCITNKAAGMTEDILSDEEVVNVGRRAAGHLRMLLEQLLPKLAKDTER